MFIILTLISPTSHEWVILKMPRPGTHLSCRNTWATDSCKSQIMLSLQLKVPYPKNIQHQSAFGGIVYVELWPSVCTLAVNGLTPSGAYLHRGINLMLVGLLLMLHSCWRRRWPGVPLPSPASHTTRCYLCWGRLWMRASLWTSI